MTKIFSNQKRINKYQISLITLVFIYLVVAILYIEKCGVEAKGEEDSYMLPTISIIEHGSMLIKDVDIDLAAQDFPEFYEMFKERYDSGRMVLTRDGSRNPYYYCTYSIACIPLKLIFKLLGIPQHWAFAYTNLLLLISTSVIVFKTLKIAEYKRILLCALLFINPIFLYISWRSAETFIFCMLVLSSLWCYDRHYKKAAFVLSLAGTLNITVMFFGFIVIIDFFIHLYKKTEERNIFFIIRKSFWEIIKFGFCFLIVFLPFIHNWLYVNEINSTFGMFEVKDVLGRFWAYLFDLNFGIFAYMPILFLGLILVFINAIKEKDYRCISFIIGMLGIVLMYSFAFHINCGMSGISRYGAWTTACLVFIVAVFFPYEKIKKGLINIFFVLTILTGSALIFLSAETKSIEMLVVAKYVLNYFPQLYNPLYSTFNSRVNNKDGGYDYLADIPIIYRDNEYRIRKVLLNGAFIPEFLESLEGDEKGITYCVKELEKYTEKDLFYLDVPFRYTVWSDLISISTGLDELGSLYSEKSSIIVEAGGLFEVPVALEKDMYYRIDFIGYADVNICLPDVHGDFYGGSYYDLTEQEGSFAGTKYENGQYEASCILYSGDTSLANQEIVFRILNYSKSKLELKNIEITKLGKNEEK